MKLQGLVLDLHLKLYLSFPGSIVGVVSKMNGVICSVVGNIVRVMGLRDYRIYIFYLVTADRDCQSDIRGSFNLVATKEYTNITSY